MPRTELTQAQIKQIVSENIELSHSEISKRYSIHPKTVARYKKIVLAANSGNLKDKIEKLRKKPKKEFKKQRPPRKKPDSFSAATLKIEPKDEKEMIVFNPLGSIFTFKHKDGKSFLISKAQKLDVTDLSVLDEEMDTIRRAFAAIDQMASAIRIGYGVDS
jgi:hypothetical protein